MLDLQRAVGVVEVARVEERRPGGNHVVDQQTGGPQKRQDARIEEIRKVVREEVYLQLVNAWPETSGPVKGLKDPKDYKDQLPTK